jgi:hypothetical protein
MTMNTVRNLRRRPLLGLGLLLVCTALLAEPPAKPLDLSLDLDQQYIEEIIVTAEPWREPPPDDDWRHATRTLQTGNTTWGYDSAYEEMNSRRESELYMTQPELRDPQPTSTLIRVRF